MNDILEKRVAFLKKLTIFSETGEDLLHDIACELKEVGFEENQSLFKKGDTSDAIYMIVKGAVKVHDRDHIFTELHAGDVFGEYSMLEGSVRTASITTIQRTDFLKLDQHTFYKFVSDNINLTKGVFRYLVRRVQDKDMLESELAKRNHEILQQKEEIEAQRDKIELQRDQIIEQKSEITDSIQYAKRIQNAVLRTDKCLEQEDIECFVLFMPKDIVSGDFYWVKKTDNKVIVAAADCTGHGVPGAFMSILGVNALNEIINYIELNKLNFSAADFLNRLRNKIKKALGQTGKEHEAKDGMDIALCVFDLKNNVVEFAGANNPMFLIRKCAEGNYELQHYKPDKMPIGIYALEEKPFTNHRIEIASNDLIYLFSDGYVDQFGGKKGRKFLSRRFKKILLENAGKSMSEQQQELENFMYKWMQGYDQVDDILVIGVKVN